MAARVWTIGHSNTPQEVLLDQLLGAGIQRLVDIRRYPMSRRNPQFNRDNMTVALQEQDIDYVHLEALGGRREPRNDSHNPGQTNAPLRGYADHMLTPEFEAAVDELMGLADDKPTAVMCAEADPAQCHRSLLADNLTARGIDVVHIVKGVQRLHQLSPRARVEGGRVTYPALL